jgi:hypothetical protein
VCLLTCTLCRIPFFTSSLITRVGQNHVYVRCIYKFLAGKSRILAGKSRNIRSLTVYMYSSGQSHSSHLWNKTSLNSKQSDRATH